MASNRNRIAFLVAVAGLVGGVMAQPEQPPKQPPGTDSPVRPNDTYQPSNPSDRTTQPGERPGDRTDHMRREMRSVTLVPCEWIDDATVRGTNDDKIGEVKDLILAREARRITFALVGHGGVLKVGEKVTAVPFRAFEWMSDKKTLFLPMTHDQFETAPDLDSGEWKTLSDPARTEPIYSHFNTTRDDRMARPDEKINDDRPEGAPRLSPDEHPVVRVSDIRGKTLVASDGREVGKVDDLVVDANSGRIAFVAVTFGGVMGIGSDRVAVPWSAFDINKDGRLFVTNLDKETISSAPRMKEKDWGELRDPAFGANVYKHYGRKAGWLESGASAMTPAQQEYMRLYTAGTPRDLTGTIASVDEQSPMAGVPKVTVLTVNTTASDTVTVYTCPKSHLDEQRLQLRKGDTVTIKGREATVDGKRVVIVTQITGADGRPITLQHDEPERK